MGDRLFGIDYQGTYEDGRTLTVTAADIVDAREQLEAARPGIAVRRVTKI